MNILFVTHHDNFQGSSRSLMSLLEGLQEFSVVPFVVNPLESIFTEALESKGIQCEIHPVPWWISNKTFSYKKKMEHVGVIRESVPNLQKVIRKWKIDLVYTNSSVTPVGLLAARRERVPHIWHIREFGDLDFALKYIFPKGLCRRYIRSSQAIICNSHAVKKHLFDNWTSEKLHVIFNGVANKAQFDQLRELSQEMKRSELYTFLFIGSISQKKGIQVAIKACAELITQGMNVRLKIVGSGRESYVNQCRNLVESLGVAAFVEFHGYVPDPYDAYLSSDCLLMCSEHEAFGRVSAEAMSACLPVIGKNSGGTPEIIVDGETGFLYNTFDELVEAMQQLSQNPELGKKMGLEGWQRARDLFNIEDYAANVYRIIQSVMGKR